MRSYALTLLFLIFYGCTDSQAKKDIPPNVVLILADDQGWGDLSFHGNSNLNTPNIDALAKEGVSFTHFYVQPVCSPTRAELLTGRYFPRLGVYATSVGGERMNLGETTIAELFKKAGYKTAAYGKWHNGTQPPYHPNTRGFDDFYGFASGHWGNYFSPMLEHNGVPVQGQGFLVDDLTDKGLKFIEFSEKQSFFLYLPFNTPHSPMQVPDRYWERFKSRPLAQTAADSLEENKNFTRAALAMVENIDYNVGRITRKLQDLDLEENTIVIYLSDNGPNGWRWNGGLRGRKGHTDEGGVRSPFFVKWKGTIPMGRSIDYVAGAIDILPTLSGLAGIEAKTSRPLDGLDLSSVILGESNNFPKRFIFNHWGGRTSVRSSQHRLDHEERLYDLSADPGQMHDLSTKLPGLTDSLILARDQWLTEMELSNEREDSRNFTIGYPGYPHYQLPARDGLASGNIIRSNKYPNCSFFTNWKSTQDKIIWPLEVLSGGKYEVILYYTCKPKNVGSTIRLAWKESGIDFKITEVFDPPLRGMEHDRNPRIESYVKDFKAVKLGDLHLSKGEGNLELFATDIPGNEVIDLRMLYLKKLE